MKIYVIEKKVKRRWMPIALGPKLSIDEMCKYYNGFAHGTKRAIYRCAEYVRK